MAPAAEEHTVDDGSGTMAARGRPTTSANRRAARRFEANSQDLVGQPLHQLASGRIGDQPAEPAQLASLAAGRVGERLTQQRVGQRNRLFDTPPSHCRVAGPRHHRRIRRPRSTQHAGTSERSRLSTSRRVHTRTQVLGGSVVLMRFGTLLVPVAALGLLAACGDNAGHVRQLHRRNRCARRDRRSGHGRDPQAGSEAAGGDPDRTGDHRRHRGHGQGRRRRRHADRALRRRSFGRWGRVRQQLRHRRAVLRHGRSRAGHQGLGRRAHRNEAGWSPATRHPGRPRLRRSAAVDRGHPDPATR